MCGQVGSAGDLGTRARPLFGPFLFSVCLSGTQILSLFPPPNLLEGGAWEYWTLQLSGEDKAWATVEAFLAADWGAW